MLDSPAQNPHNEKSHVNQKRITTLAYYLAFIILGLTIAALDPVSKIPSFKVCAVKVELIS
jgi:hypothetical protein